MSPILLGYKEQPTHKAHRHCGQASGVVRGFLDALFQTQTVSPDKVGSSRAAFVRHVNKNSNTYAETNPSQYRVEDYIYCSFDQG